MTRFLINARSQFLKISNQYEKQSQSDPNFSGAEYSIKTAQEFGCTQTDPKTFQVIPGMECDERWLGMLIRRRIDGSLPAILEILNQILKEFYKEEFSRGKLIL